MADIAIVKALWSGFNGAPGTSTFAIRDTAGTGSPTSSQVTACVGAIRTFFNAFAATIQNGVSISFDGNGTIVNEVDGELKGSVAYTVPTVVSCSGSGTVAAPAGASIRWNTAGIRNGRRVRGRTFIVPLVATSYESNGTLTSTFLTTATTAATGLISAATSSASWSPCVWSRPVSGAGGFAWPFVTSSVKDEVAVLASRRN